MNRVHFAKWVDHEMVSPCGVKGSRTLSHDIALVDCIECLTQLAKELSRD